MNKNELRKVIKNQSIDPAQKKFEERYLTEILTSILQEQNPTCIGLFASTAEEVNLKAIFKKANELDIPTAYPKIMENQLTFHKVDSLEMLVPTLPYGIYEPVAHSPLMEPDLIIVPGIGFTKTGKRLGRGKGYYDRYLSQNKAYTISLAFSWQVLDDLPTEDHDIDIKKVISCALTVAK